MSPRFTPLIERLAKNEPLEPDDFTEIGRVLKSILKMRGLLSQTPMILGYVECVSWQSDESLSSLAADAISGAIKPRVRNLHARVKMGQDVDGLVKKILHHYVTELQKRGDPVGRSVYENVKGGVEVSVKHQESVHEGTKVAAETVVGPKLPVAAPAPRPVLREALVGKQVWTELLTQLGAVGTPAKETVRTALPVLYQAQVGGVHVRRLTETLRDDVRKHWKDSELREPTIVTEKTEDGEEWIRFTLMPDVPLSKVLAEIEAAIHKRVAQARKRERLVKFLRTWAEAVSEGEPDIKGAELGRRLGIPRSVVSEYIQDLREIISWLYPDD